MVGETGALFSDAFLRNGVNQQCVSDMNGALATQTRMISYDCRLLGVAKIQGHALPKQKRIKRFICLSSKDMGFSAEQIMQPQEKYPQ